MGGYVVVVKYQIRTTEVAGSILTPVQLQVSFYWVLRLTQPSTLSGTENKYLPMGSDALWLGSNGRCGSCLVAGKTVRSIV